MNLKPEEISSVIKKRSKDILPICPCRSGHGYSGADGIARIHGLEKAMQGELLEFRMVCGAWCSTWRRIT